VIVNALSSRSANVYLIGFMGAGKSTVGPLLARCWGWRFFDSDQEVEALSGQSVGWLFDNEGEDAFRAYESAALAQLSVERGCVVAVGGGAPTRALNWRALRTGLSVYLRLPAATLAQRLAGVERPLLAKLSCEDRQKKVADLLNEREPCYRQADLVVPAVGTLTDVVTQITKGVQSCRL